MDSGDGILYRLWLNILCDHNPRLIHKCIEGCGSAEEIYNSDALYKRAVSSLGIRARLKARRDLDAARQLAEFCAESGIDIISIDDKRYPRRLAEIYMPPQLIYVKGELPDIDSLISITVVGSRECSDYGRKFANDLAYDLAKAGVFIVSGMAMGIDAAAHRGALAAGHMTAAVLAGGVDVVYPAANRELYREIVQSGAIISERPPQTVGRGNFYRERNRILAGLSCGVVIVEGGESSGTKLTANHAIDSDRDLFAVPGKPGDEGAELPNRLIKDSAKLVTSAEDIISEYISVYPIELKRGIDLIDETRSERRQRRRNDNEPKDAAIPSRSRSEEKKPPRSFENFDGKHRIILEYLYHNNGAHIDDISRDCGIAMSELSFLIIQLEMQQVIRQSAGEHFWLV